MGHTPEYNRAYYLANLEKLRARHRERQRAWSEANPGANAAASRKWREANLAQAKAQRSVHTNARRVATKAGDLTVDEWSSIIAMYCGRCAYCGDAANEMDHVDALSRGGEHAADNVVPACGTCNRSKGARSLLEHLVARENRRARLAARSV